MYSTQQATISSSIKVEGRGIHLGNQNQVVLSPAAPDSGLIFQYKESQTRYLFPQVKGSARGTNIDIGGTRISTIEHLISALVGSGIDNCLIEIKEDEVPITDGSSLIFSEQIEKTGVEELNKPRKFIEIDSPIIVQDENKFIIALPSQEFEVTFLFDHPLLDPQIGYFNLFKQDYVQQIAPARTFGFAEEVEQLKAKGLIRGADLESALLIENKKASAKLRFNNEIVRHKILDLIGDVYAAGALPRAHIIAVRSGHLLNSRLVEEMITRI